MVRILSAIVALFAIVVAAPVRAAPCAGFTDVEDTSPFCANVAWMRNRGITFGCTATLYCPNDFVTRLQMAAFMYRLGFQNAFLQGGNAFGTTAVLGTDDAQPVEIRANNARVMRYEPNTISPNVIGGSGANSVAAGVRGATIAGGGVGAGDTDPNFTDEAPNRVTDAYGTVGGGYANRAGDDAGGATNTPFATVAGGTLNAATSNSSSVGGGARNTAGGIVSTVGGGADNVATGTYATVPGGIDNRATGTASFAAGRNANAGSDGCFVWSDNSSINETQCGVANAFVARAKGGFYLITGGTLAGGYTGALLAPGATSWTTFSDRNGKENLADIDARAILDKVVALPIATWNWKTQEARIRHIGPMAQDFHAAFGLGETVTGINTVDADGIALAAIQGLNAKLAEQAREIAELRQMVERLARP